MPKNLCFQIVVLEKTLESHLDSKEIKLVNTKGNHPESSLEGLILKLNLQYFGHLMQRADSLGKNRMLGKSEDKRSRENQRMRCLDSNTLDVHEFEQTLGDSGGQKSLVCYSPWGYKESNMT